jgi:hypothetical protein
MNAMQYSAPEIVGRWQQRALLVGAAALAVSVVGAFFNRTQFFRSYLLGFLFWMGIALGSLAILMLQHLTGGAWGLVIRRPLESATRTLPLLAVFFIPLAFNLPPVYTWTQRGTLPPHKAVYLTIPFFLFRAAIYFAAWMLLMFLANKWSRQQDANGDAALKRKLARLSGPALVLLGFLITFAAVDWIMSLDPAWFSSIFGVLILGGQLVSAMALMIAVCAGLGNQQPMEDVYQSRHYHDLGKLLLAFVMLWAYFSVSQLIIIWSGNLTEEIPWYLHRLNGGWRWIGLLLVVFNFVLPFFFLLSRDLKRRGKLLAWVSLLLLAARLVDVYWLTAPEFWPGAIHFHWMDIALPLGIGGIWLALFFRGLRQLPLLPIGDRQLGKAIEHEAH